MVNRKTRRNKRINRRKSVSRNKFMGGANTPTTTRSQLQIELLHCRDMLAQRNQEIAELTAAAVTAEPIPDAAAVTAEPIPDAALADLPVAQLSARRDDSIRHAIEADINNRDVRGRHRSIISRMLPYRRRPREPLAARRGPGLPIVENERGNNGWVQRGLPNGDRVWWNTRTHVTTRQLPRNIRSRIVPGNGSGSGSRNIKKKNKKKSKKRKEKAESRR